MKKRIYLKVVLGMMLLITITFNFNNSLRNTPMPDLILANVEALADDDEGSNKVWTAPRIIACDYQQGPWHTASIETICEFCVTPNSCTPRACGM